MNVHVQPHVTTTQQHLPFECVALALQGCRRVSRPGFRPSRTAVSSRTLLCGGWSIESRAATPWHCRSTYGAHAASFHATCSNSSHERKEIRYSSHTRAGTDQSKHVQELRRAVAGLLEKLPEDLRNSPEAKLLSTAADRKVYNIAHLIYRAKDYEGHSKDYEFSLLSMEEHWRASYHDAPRTLRHREVLERDVFTFDLAEDGRE